MYLAADIINPLKNSCTLVKLGEGHGPEEDEGVTNLSCNLTTNIKHDRKVMNWITVRVLYNGKLTASH